MFDSLCFFSASDWHGITYQGGGMGGQHGFAGCYDNVSFSVPWPPPPVLIRSCIATEDFSRPRENSLSLFSPSFCPCFKKLTLADFGAALAIQDRDKVIPASTEQLGYKPPKYYGIGHSTKKGELWA